MSAPPMAYYGGKTRLASKIVALLPPHEHYVEPYAGALSVLLAKPQSRMETVNDLDGMLMTFWRVLREKPEQLARACALTPHSRAEYFAARDADLSGLDDVEQARLVWVNITQSYGGTLRRTGWRMYVDPSNSKTPMPGYLDAYVERIAIAAERLHHVSLECRPALEIIDSFGKSPKCCLYVDPPYLGDARTSGGAGYRCDMLDESDHVKLLSALLKCKSAVVLSGYQSELYDSSLSTWERVEIPHMTGNARGEKGRTEVVWSNRPIANLTLFEAIR